MSDEMKLTGVLADESPSLGKLAEALAKAQGAMKPAPKDSKNPFFNSTYADLASVWGVIREPLAANGLSIIQSVSTTQRGAIITTRLLHSSGEWIRERLEVVIEQTISKDNKKQSWIQAFGSAVTYARRYAISAMVGVAAEDDDGEAASQAARESGGQRKQQSAPRQQAAPAPAAESLVGKVRFGKRMGVPLADLDNDSLTWYANRIATSTKPEDVAMSHDIEAEWERRGMPQVNGAASTQ